MEQYKCNALYMYTYFIKESDYMVRTRREYFGEKLKILVGYRAQLAIHESHSYHMHMHLSVR